MAVYSDFERKYRFAADPWAATSRSDYYEALRGFIRRWKSQCDSILDCGCGEGYFTSQLQQFSENVHGIDVSRTAIERARKQYPGGHWHTCDLRDISRLDFSPGRFDLIICSQVLYYFSWSEATTFLSELEELLSSGGLLCVAANCSGGNYFTPSELRALVEESFEVVGEQPFEHHLFLAAVRRPVECVLTVDYEVAEHEGALRALPEVWERQVIQPCFRLLEVCEEFQVPLTIFLELAQYWFLKRYLPESAARIRAQLSGAILRGHDVQVHLHARWLPDLGARVDADNRTILLNLDKPRLHDLPRETRQDLLARAREFLESLLRPIRDSYRAIVFRSGKYQIQPHREIFLALDAAGYLADSSVWHGGFLSIYDRNPGFDFRSLWHAWRPYRPTQHDVCVPATPGEPVPAVVEIPILAHAGEQWSFDTKSPHETLSLWRRLRRGGGPRVMIGHTKMVTPDVLDSLRYLLRELSQDRGVVFSTFQKTAETWHSRCQSASYQEARKAYVRRSSLSPSELWALLSPYHRRKVELLASIITQQARENGQVQVLDVGCGTGELVTFPLYHQVCAAPDITIRGIDINRASIARAAETASVFSLEGISFDSTPLQGVVGEYDVIVCCEVLEHLSDPLPFLELLSQWVGPNGRLVVTTPNGYGYKEIERRVLYGAFEMALRLPARVKKRLRGGYRMLRNRLKASLRVSNDSVRSADRPIMGTLNFQNDIHVQCFSLAKLIKLLRTAGFETERIYNVQCLGGLGGALLERMLPLDRFLNRMPSMLVADWLLVCRPVDYENAEPEG
jgi:2-polyprenyl-3-methyl-5-hydroxy-6-metoxy-1,4-benzoquinol methylase